MKSKCILYFVLLLGLCTLGMASEQETNKNTEKANYILGFQEGNSLREKKYEIDPPSFHQGLIDGYTGVVIPDNIESQRDSVVQMYINWIFDQSNSKFSVQPPATKYIQMFSYFMGFDYGKDFRDKYFKLNETAFIQGISDALASKTSTENLEDFGALDGFYNATENIRQEVTENELSKSMRNQSFEKKLEQGITYTIISSGTKSDKPSANSSVSIQYVLSHMVDGHVQNIRTNRINDIDLATLAPGVQIALKNMQEGEHTLFSIPSPLLIVQNTQQKPENMLVDITLIKINTNPSQGGEINPAQNSQNISQQIERLNGNKIQHILPDDSPKASLPKDRKANSSKISSGKQSLSHSHHAKKK